jgi:hypothetical protein
MLQSNVNNNMVKSNNNIKCICAHKNNIRTILMLQLANNHVSSICIRECFTMYA